MKSTLPVILISLFMVTFGLSQGIPIRGPEASPELKKAIDQFNADAAAWNRRCAVAHSQAEQSWCEEERALLDSRKARLTAGGGTYADYTTRNPEIKVTLREKTGGKILKQVKTDATGNFAMGTFPASIYMIEFRASSASEVKNQSFAIDIDGTKSRGRAAGFPGRYIAAGLAIEVETVSGMPVSGLITPGSSRNTRKMIWLPQQIGSNLPGGWAEEGSSQAVAAFNWGHIRIESIRKMQDHGDQ